MWDPKESKGQLVFDPVHKRGEWEELPLLHSPVNEANIRGEEGDKACCCGHVFQSVSLKHKASSSSL